MMLISIIVTRPPLHVAIPLQAVAVWRASHAGFCSLPLLRHAAVLQRTSARRAWAAGLAGQGGVPCRPCLLRTCVRRHVGASIAEAPSPLPPLADLLHWGMSLVLAGAFASPMPMTSLILPEGDTPRCEAALLFFNLLVGGLLPLLLLVPLSGNYPQGSGAGDARRRPQASGQLARLERRLGRTLGLFIYERHGAEGRRAGRVTCSSLLAMRWMVLVACTWVVSCVLYS